MREDDPAPQLELEFPPKPEYIRTARHAAVALARIHGVPENLIDDLKLVVSEACTQAVRASASIGDAGPVRLVVSEQGGKLTTEVLDRGPGPDAMLDGAPRPDAMLDGRVASWEGVPDIGLSLPLIRGLVDELEVAPREGGGTHVRMVMSPEGNRG